VTPRPRRNGLKYAYSAVLTGQNPVCALDAAARTVPVPQHTGKDGNQEDDMRFAILLGFIVLRNGIAVNKQSDTSITWIGIALLMCFIMDLADLTR
jgi:hypothetical protein